MKNIIYLTLMLFIFLIPLETKASEVEYYDSNNASNVTVINFHYFGEEGSNPNLERVRNSKKQFHTYLSELKKEGYTTIGQQDLIRYLEGNQQIPKKSILLTIDDGFLSVYTEAFPVLKELEMKAVFFPIVGDMLKGDRKDSPMVSFEQLEEMVQSGLVEVGNHTFDLHWRGESDTAGNEAMIYKYDRQSKLVNNRFDYIFKDLILADYYIEEHTSQEIDSISYPYGVYTKETLIAAQNLGYKIGYTTKAGTNYFGYGANGTNLLEVHRIGSNSNTTTDSLLKNIEKYNQLAAQEAFKKKDIRIRKEGSRYKVYLMSDKESKKVSLDKVTVEVYKKNKNGVREFINEKTVYTDIPKSGVVIHKKNSLKDREMYSLKFTLERKDKSKEVEWIDLQTPLF